MPSVLDDSWRRRRNLDGCILVQGVFKNDDQPDVVPLAPDYFSSTRVTRIVGLLSALKEFDPYRITNAAICSSSGTPDVLPALRTPAIT